ncbi:MAG: hypothetical protein GF372_10640 [Candidatus Marinimicrobia bacterium]|nr:hypothetical protein [Candidatus Neomarinimicrobiota bacterium]
MTVPRDVLSSRFFEEILEVARKFGGELLVQRFYNIKQERERYLREQWAEYSDDIGPVLIRDIDYDHLLTLLKTALESDFDSLFEALLKIGKICLKFGQFEKVRSLILNIELPSDALLKQAEIKMLLGKLSILTSDYEAGTDNYTAAAKIYEQLENYRGIASAYNNLGIISYEQWQTDPGKKYFNKAVDLFERFEDTALKMAIQGNLATVETMRGESQVAAEIYERLLPNIAEENFSHRVHIMTNMGIAILDAGNITRAEQTLQEAFSLAERVKEQRMIALIKVWLADIQVLKKKYSEALEGLHEAFKVFSSLHYTKGLADIYRVFGILHTAQGYTELAEKEFQISLRINREQGSILNLAEVYYSYSKLAENMKDFEKQKEYLENSLLLYKSMQAVKRIEKIESELDALSESD